MDLSIIVPLYYGKKYIPKLTNMLEKNIKVAKKYSIEVIFVNDSPDEIINENLFKRYSNFKLITNEKNLGIQRARIKGINNACGDKILMLDQDDLLSSDAIKSQLECIKDSDAVLANGFVQLPNGRLKSLYGSFAQQELANSLKYYLYYGNMVASPGLVIIKKNIIPNAWLNNYLTISGADDWLLWAGFIANGNSFKMNRKKIYTHINVGSNFSSNEKRMIESSFEALKILKQNNKINSREFGLHNRRLKMRKEILGNPKGKYKEYLKNPDVAWNMLIYKLYAI